MYIIFVPKREHPEMEKIRIESVASLQGGYCRKSLIESRLRQLPYRHYRTLCPGDHPICCGTHKKLLQKTMAMDTQDHHVNLVFIGIGDDFMIGLPLADRGDRGTPMSALLGHHIGQLPFYTAEQVLPAVILLSCGGLAGIEVPPRVVSLLEFDIICSSQFNLALGFDYMDQVKLCFKFLGKA